MAREVPTQRTCWVVVDYTGPTGEPHAFMAAFPHGDVARAAEDAFAMVKEEGGVRLRQARVFTTDPRTFHPEPEVRTIVRAKEYR